MADTRRKVAYRYLVVQDRPGEGARVLEALSAGGVNLKALHAFPAEGGKAQIDLVAADDDALTRVAGEAGFQLSERKTAFLVQGDDRPGAAAELLRQLGTAGINVKAMDAVCANGRFGALFWVNPAEVDAAARALGAS